MKVLLKLKMLKVSIATLVILTSMMYSVTAQSGNALSFDGTDDYVDCGNGSSFQITNSITLEAWINADLWRDNSWEGTIVGTDKDNDGSGGYVLRCGNNGTLSFTFGNNESWPEVTSSEVMSTGQWYHVACVYDGSMMRIYIDGVLSGENAISTSISASPKSLYIGSSPGFSGRNFNGKIDEVRVWNKARSACQINNDMNKTLNGNELGLVAYYSFNQGTAEADNSGFTTLPDMTSNANNGTLNGFALNGTTSNWLTSGAGATTAAPDVIVTTTGVSNITTTTADISGSISNIGSGNATLRGICYNTTGCPTIADLKVEESGSFGIGNFTKTISSLDAEQKYYTKAYAQNATGVSYGDEVSFCKNAVYIPDNKFLNALIDQGVDINGDGVIQQSEALSYSSSLNVSDNSISDLTGIEAFTNITSLYCSYNSLTNLDVSSLTSLTEIECYSNQLTSLDVSSNTNLQTLVCYDNLLTSLNVTGLTSLSVIDCNNNKFTSLDVSSNTALQKLFCYTNQLTSLNLSGLSSITEIDCNNNKLTSLNISGLTSLTVINCSSNQLTNLDVSSNTALQYLYCNENGLTSLNVSGLTSLNQIDCYTNQLTSLDVSSNTALHYLYCYDNVLTSLNVSGLTTLYRIDCYTNKLTSLDVSSNTNLQTLDCYDNLLTSLNVTGLTSLSELYCYNNQLTALDVSTNTALQNLRCYYNLLTSLNVSGLTSLSQIYCNNNQLTSIDVSTNTNLHTLYCFNNQLTEMDVTANSILQELDCRNNNLMNLDVHNGNNNNIYNFDATNNPYLSCIRVDDVDYSNTNWTNIDVTASFNTDCPGSIQWTGATDNDWNNSSNWNPTSVPTASDNVVIPNVTNNPIINQDASNPAVCKSIIIKSSAVVTINAAKAFTVNGMISNC